MSGRKRKLDYNNVDVDPSKRRRSESYAQAGSPHRRRCHHGDRFPGRQSEKYELFFGWQSPFSQHHLVNFTVDGKDFNCAEQYYMYRKAALFEDWSIVERIMNSKDPKEQKRLGKQIKNFDRDTWMQHSQGVVEKGNMAKFSQNPPLKEKLFATAPRLMVEASPHDDTWGIALHRNDPRAWDERTWRGQNLLGQIITRVRDNLMKQDGVLVDKGGGSIGKTDDSINTVNSSGGYKRTSNDDTNMDARRVRSQGFNQGKGFPGRQSEKYELFFGRQSPFSQHHPVKFKVDGKDFNCAEQYYMYRKAALFEDWSIVERIMNSKDPKEQKRLGKQIKNFDRDTWMQHSQKVVEKGNMAKFSQNPHLKEKLFATAPRLMVEASPHDDTWGIALHKNDPRAWDERTWRGQNLLGQIITRVRDNLMKQDGVLVGKGGGSIGKTDDSINTVNSSGGYKRTSDDDTNMDVRRVRSKGFNQGKGFPGRQSEKYELFFGRQSPFSQHHPVKFKVDGKDFNCAEQYYMYRKAALFEDWSIVERIMNSKDPKEQKRLGKQIKNFDRDTWMQHSQKVVEKGNMAKFSQNPHLKEKLFATAPRLMVEASPHDDTWGIALHKNDPRAWDERTWRGQNLLGQIITRVRDNLMKQDGVLVGKGGGSIGKTDDSINTVNSSGGYQRTSDDDTNMDVRRVRSKGFNQGKGGGSSGQRASSSRSPRAVFIKILRKNLRILKVTLR